MLELTLASVVARRSRLRGEEAAMVERYLQRLRRLLPCEIAAFETEAALLEFAGRTKGSGRAGGRPAAKVILFDGRGQMVSSEEFAGLLGRIRDEGAQRLVLGIGPADGWSEAAREEARRSGGLISFGRITLPHELAQVVAAEQVYRAWTILAGHPYHGGHV